MARGWESKDVESQIEDARIARRSVVPADPAADIIRRERERWELERTRLLSELQRACHPRHRGQLEAALEHITRQLAGLG